MGFLRGAGEDKDQYVVWLTGWQISTMRGPGGHGPRFEADLGGGGVGERWEIWSGGHDWN